MASNEEDRRHVEMTLGRMTSFSGLCRLFSSSSSSSSSSPSSHTPSAAPPPHCSSCAALASWSSSASKTRIAAKPKTTFFILLLTCADIVVGIPSSPVASSLPLPILGDGPHDLAIHRNASTLAARKHINYHNYVMHSFSLPSHRDWKKHDRYNHASSLHASTTSARQSARHERPSSDKAKEKTKNGGDDNRVRGSGRSPSSSSPATANVKTANVKTTNVKTSNVKGSKQKKPGKKEIFKIHITKAWRNSQTTTTRSPPSSSPHPHASSTPPPPLPPSSTKSSPTPSHHFAPSFPPPSLPTAPHPIPTSSPHSSSLYKLPISSSHSPSTASLHLPSTSSPPLPSSSSIPSSSSPSYPLPLISSNTPPISSLPPPSSQPPNPSPSFSSSASPPPNSSSVETTIISQLSSSSSRPSSLSPTPPPPSSTPYVTSSPPSSSSSSPPTTEERADTTMLSGRVLLEMQNFSEAQMMMDEGPGGYDVDSKVGDVTSRSDEVTHQGDVTSGGDVTSSSDITSGRSDVTSLGTDTTFSPHSLPLNRPSKLSTNYSSQTENLLPKVTVNNNQEKNSKQSLTDVSSENTISHYIKSGYINNNNNSDNNPKPTAAAMVSETTDSSNRNSIENSVPSSNAINRTQSNSVSNASNIRNSGLVSNLLNLINNRSRLNSTSENVTYTYNDTKATRDIVDKIYNASDARKSPSHVKLDSLEVELSGKSETAKDLLLAIYILQHHDLLGLNESYPDASVPDAKDIEEEVGATGDGEAVEEHLKHIAEAAEEAQKSKSENKDKDRHEFFRSQAEEKAVYNSLSPFPKDTSYEATETPPVVSTEKVTTEVYEKESEDALRKTTSKGELRSSSKSGKYEVEVLDSFSPTSDYDFTTYSEEPPDIADDEEVSMQEPETCFLWFVLVMDGNCSVIKPRMNTFVTFLKAALSAKVPLEYEDVHVPSVFCDASFMVNISIDSKKYPDVDKRLQSLAAANVTLLEISGEIFYLEKVLTRRDQNQERGLLGKKADDVEIVIYIAVGCMCAFIILSVVIVTLIKICKQDLEAFDLNKHHTLSGNDFPIRRPNVIYSPRFTQDLDPEKYRLRPFEDSLVVESTSRCGGAGGGGVGGGGGPPRMGSHPKEDLCPSPLRYGSEQVEEVTIEAPEQFRDDFTPLVDSDTNDKDELCEVIFDSPSPRRTRKTNITAMAKRAAAAAAAAAATTVRPPDSQNLTLVNPCYDR